MPPLWKKPPFARSVMEDGTYQIIAGERRWREQQLSTGLLLARALRMDAGNWSATLTHSCRKDGDPV